ncbi:peptide-methionine (S)-S-oxide reductase MsrA [Hoeflea poritis]|uniref:Peptide methionine sulfoxide reductase MsrA n=1 Tax=Hoeflea poritis TaxID=2993659 RepID=A0ABT4VKH3_9HYPH|nr:peptide-methionine (S)-S-oxide reductase MsrA [Hoeflea poritis]MDA4845171.1 peptide-methionine (S)-S-oxide reductase MsrA [Hoeflea poritis]
MFSLNPFSKKTQMPSAAEALPGRETPLETASHHFVNGHALKGPYPEGLETAYFAMGCFWGVERLFWQRDGVFVTAVGYAGGLTPNPTYEETVTGMTGHAEAVLVVFDPQKVSYDDLLKIFWEEHDPTQGMRQGNDVGTTYRSAIYTVNEAQASRAKESLRAYQQSLRDAGFDRQITTQIEPAGPFYFAEDYHQQYLAKNPNGYCGVKGTGVACAMA